MYIEYPNPSCCVTTNRRNVLTNTHPNELGRQLDLGAIDVDELLVIGIKLTFDVLLLLLFHDAEHAGTADAALILRTGLVGAHVTDVAAGAALELQIWFEFRFLMFMKGIVRIGLSRI